MLWSRCLQAAWRRLALASGDWQTQAGAENAPPRPIFFWGQPVLDSWACIESLTSWGSMAWKLIEIVRYFWIVAYVQNKSENETPVLYLKWNQRKSNFLNKFHYFINLGRPKPISSIAARTSALAQKSPKPSRNPNFLWIPFLPKGE